MAGWDSVERHGSEYIRSMLADCVDPVQVIERFQSENAFQAPTLPSALPLLDLHGITRQDFYSGLLSRLSERLLRQVKKLSADEVTRLIDEALRYAHIEVVQPIFMQLLELQEKIPEHILDKLASDTVLYYGCSLRVKREIWERNSSLFANEISVLLERYIDAKEVALLCSKLDGAVAFFDTPPRTRRQHPVVRQFVEMLGTSWKLYEMLVDFLKQLFIDTQNEHYCTLRCEVLMALHDGEVNTVCSQEPCHKFVWCLDACIRERCVDDKRTKELATFLDLKPSQDQMRGDLAMIVHDPFVVHLLLLSVLSTLEGLAKEQSLPRDCHKLKVLIRLLNLGLNAVTMLENKDYKEPLLDNNLLLRNSPALVSLYADDIIRSISVELQSEGQAGSDAEAEDGYPPLSESFSEQLASSPFLFQLTICYTAQLAQRRSSRRLLQVLPVLTVAAAVSGVAATLPPTLWHLLTGRLAQLPANVLNCRTSDGQTPLVTIALEQLLIPLARSDDTCLGHALRVLTIVRPSLEGSLLLDCTDWLSKLQPNEKSSPLLWQLYAETAEVYDVVATRRLE